jgi:glycosyltransferase involved in cell wall biosynthesis
LKIGINARFLLKDKLEGIGWFSYETLKRICIDHPEHEFYFFFDRPYDREFIFADNIKPIVLFPPARHPFLFYMFFEWSIADALKKYKIDYFISPDGFLSLRTNVPSLSVIHDIAFEHRPLDVPYLMRKYYHYYFPKFAKKATRIATVSEYSKQDLIQTYGISTDKIDVVYNGANEAYTPISDEAKKEFKIKFSKSEDYFLYVGSINPRKNLGNLLKAFDLYKETYKSKSKLLIVGKKMHDTSEVSSIYESMIHKEEVIFTGRLSNSDLHRALASAIALTYVPYFEGFGIPILEAYYCNTPVITSNTSSLPEVAGDAALYVEPDDFEGLSKKMDLIESDPELRAQLIHKMQGIKSKFSWDKTAKALWDSFEKMINNAT